MYNVTYVSKTLPNQGALVLTVAAGQNLGSEGRKIDQKLGKVIQRAMASSPFTGAKNQVLSILAPGKTKISRIILLGVGEPKALTEVACQKAGGALWGTLSAGKEVLATFLFDEHKGNKLESAVAAAQVAFGARLRSYRFDKYRTQMKADQKTTLKTLALAGNAAALKKTYGTLEKIAEGVFFTRDLTNEPANVIYPESLAAECRKLSKIGVKVEVLDEKALTKLGMRALLGVAQGSHFPPRVVVLSWMGAGTAKDKRPVVFVGKGVTFDTGGISLKPAAGMEEMKRDMAGAATVIGAIKVLASRKAKANVIGVIGLVENMPDGKAQRPGDIVKSMSGQTIEILNTDAEGRLVLADALWYAQERFKPRCVVDLATLTGAVKIALGTEYAALFANDEKFERQLLDAGKAVDENLWCLPMNDSYDKTMDSPVADVKNIGDGSVGAGTILGALFIRRFVKKETTWAHIDIASVAWTGKDKPLSPRGSTAFGVRLLDRLVADCFEA